MSNVSAIQLFTKIREQRKKIEEKHGPLLIGGGGYGEYGASLLGAKYGEICETLIGPSPRWESPFWTDEQLHEKLLELAGITLHLLICLEEDMQHPRARC